MPASRSALGAVVVSVVAAPAAAQSVDSVVVAKVRQYQQTDASGPVLLAPSEGPYGFDANVSGEDMDLLAAPSVIGPFSNPEPAHNGGVLGLNEGEWRYGFPEFRGWGAETQAELDALFGTGTYTFSVAGQTVDVVLGAAAFPAGGPALTLSGGAWEGGVYRIDADSELTLQCAGFPEFGVAGVETAAFLGVFSDDFGTETLALGSDGGTGALTLTIPADTLTPGQTYNVDALHTVATDLRPLGFGAPDSLVVGAYENGTEALIVVNDEAGCPADLAEPFGVLDLSDIVAFVGAFTMLDPAADFDDNGVFDLSDITAFVSAFVAGCP